MVTKRILLMLLAVFVALTNIATGKDDSRILKLSQEAFDELTIFMSGGSIKHLESARLKCLQIDSLQNLPGYTLKTRKDSTIALCVGNVLGVSIAPWDEMDWPSRGMLAGAFVVVCKPNMKLKNSLITGMYRKLSGAGGVFENALLGVVEINDEDYKISTYDSQGQVEYEANATLVKKNKLIWTDKMLPMTIEFKDKKAKFIAGEKGQYGVYIFEK
ncbi:MAG: hypothetical protein NTV54_04190 [Ignavibacteriales bacterium]|nr:hypothetical protein [Ignavibacteriales bacterium]